jgi:hypothetical protein
MPGPKNRINIIARIDPKVIGIYRGDRVLSNGEKIKIF